MSDFGAYYTIEDVEHLLRSLDFNIQMLQYMKSYWIQAVAADEPSNVLPPSIVQTGWNHNEESIPNDIILSNQTALDHGGFSRIYDAGRRASIQVDQSNHYEAEFPRINEHVQDLASSLPDQSQYPGFSEPTRMFDSHKQENWTSATKVFVGGIPQRITEEQLHERFQEFGQVASAVIIKGKEGKSRRFGYVVFFSKESADASLGLHKFGTGTIQVCSAYPKPKKWVPPQVAD